MNQKFIHNAYFEQEVISMLRQILHKENIIMATLQDVLADVQQESDIDDSIITLLTNISQQLKDAQAQNDPAAIQSVINQIDANKKKISDAVTANTSVQPPVAAQ